MTSATTTHSFIREILHLYETSRENKQERNAVKEKILSLSKELFQDIKLKIEPYSELKKAILLLNKLQPKFFHKFLNQSERFCEVLKRRFPLLWHQILNENPTQKKQKRPVDDDLISINQFPSFASTALAEKLKDEKLSQEEKDNLICATIGKHPFTDPGITQYSSLINENSSQLTKQTVAICNTLHTLWSTCCQERRYIHSEEQEFWLKIKELQQQTSCTNNLSYFIYLMHYLQPKDANLSEEQIAHRLLDFETHKPALLQLMRNALFSAPPSSKKGKEKADNLPSMYAPDAREEEEEIPPDDMPPLVDADQPIPPGKEFDIQEFSEILNAVVVENFALAANLASPNWKLLFLLFDCSLSNPKKISQKEASIKIARFIQFMPYCHDPQKLDHYFQTISKYLSENLKKEVYQILFIHRLSHRLFESLGFDLSTCVKLWRLFHEKALNIPSKIDNLFFNTAEKAFNIKKTDFSIEDEKTEIYYIALKKMWKFVCIQPDRIEDFLLAIPVNAPTQVFLQRVQLTAFLTDWNQAIQYLDFTIFMRDNQPIKYIQACYPHIPWFLTHSSVVLQAMAAMTEDQEIQDFVIAQTFFSEWCQHTPAICPETLWEVMYGNAQKNNQTILTVVHETWLQTLSSLEDYQGMDIAQFKELLRNSEKRQKVFQDFIGQYQVAEGSLITQKFHFEQQASRGLPNISQLRINHFTHQAL